MLQQLSQKLSKFQLMWAEVKKHSKPKTMDSIPDGTPNVACSCVGVTTDQAHSV